MNNRTLDVRLIGPAVEHHRISIDDFERLIHNIQLAIKRLGQRIAGQEGKRFGRIARDIESACSLDIVALKAGSVAVQLSLPTPQSQQPLFGDTGVNAIERLLDGMAMLSKKSAGWPSDFDPSVTDPMLEVGRILKHGVNEIVFTHGKSAAKRRVVKYTPKIRNRIEKQIEAPSPAQVVISGVLLEIDFKDKTAEIHEPIGNVIRIAFDQALEEVLLAGARKHVKVVGYGDRDHSGRIIRAKINHLEIVEQDSLPKPATSQVFFESLHVSEDPFIRATPLIDVSAVFHGFPDTRKVEDIFTELRSARKPRNLDD